jgi:hypothetical protein
MQSDFRSALVLMCRRILHSLVKILIRYGVSAGEFKAIVDSVYAHAGSEYLGESGERVTFSKLAVITGINRAFLPNILNAPMDVFQPRSNAQLHRAARVLNGWYDDAKFGNRAGTPAALKIERGKGATFKLLCELYSGNVYYHTMLSELERVGAVRRVGRDKVRAVRRTPVADGANVDSLVEVGEIVGDLVATLNYNLSVGPDEALPVGHYVARVDSAAIPGFRRQIRHRTESAMETMETILESHRIGADQKEPSAKAVELGAAMFAIWRNPEWERPHNAADNTSKKRKM